MESIEPVTLNFRLVPVINRYAYASYVDSWDDPGYIESMQTLPTTEMEDGNYLWFEVKGDSMTSETYPSIEEGDYILGRELYKHHWQQLQLRRIKVWIIVHRTKGILIKEIVKQDKNIITCHSWNRFIEPFPLDLNDINQLFYFKQLLRTKM
jgi:phage repressor protein C with HTH and peptisase S24 domain